MNRLSNPQTLAWLLPLLALQLPFELDRPLLRIGPIAFTNVELTLLLSLAAAVCIAWRSGFRWPPLAWCVLGAWFAVALFVSAISAETLNGNALRAAFRTMTGLALTLAVPVLLPNRAALRRLLTALLIGGGVAVALGWLEVELGRAFNILNPFRLTPSTAGPFVRLTGSFDYVNQTTMYAEALLPIAIAFGLRHLRYRWVTIALVGTLHLAIILSLSRAAWVTGALILLLAFAWRWIAQRKREAVWLVAFAAFALMFAVSVVRYPVFALRMTTETDTAWYIIDIDVPSELTVRANGEIDVPITIRNQSPRDFRSDTVVPINIGVRWLDGNTQLGEQRLALGRLAMDSAETYSFPLEAPQKTGSFQLEWDLVEENITWFSDKNGRVFTSTVTVEPSPPRASFSRAFGNPRPRPQPLPPDATRGTLWRVAFEMWRDQPLTGIGLDNYRLLYGERLGLARFNDGLHTNNWYIETLVSFGLFGAVPFFAWLALLINDIRRCTLRTADQVTWAIALALLTFYIHGLLDYFLIFNSTGLLFWLLVGCWLFVRAEIDSDPA